MIKIINKQRKIKVDTKKVKSNIQKILDFLGYSDFDIGIMFTTNQTIKKYNKKYRDKDKPTDILSFPYHTNLKPGQKIKIKNPEDKNLGDIIISLEQIEADHLNRILVHGIAHLLGHDHKTEKQHKTMTQFERKLLGVI